MILGTEERDRCQKGLVSCSSDWKQTVVSAEEPRALSMHTAPVLLSWGVCRWIPTRISLSPELPVTLGSPLPYTAPSGPSRCTQLLYSCLGACAAGSLRGFHCRQNFL